jgi:hypothetical protein
VIGHRLQVGIAGAVLVVAVLPAGPAWASSRHKAKVEVAAGGCPPAAMLSAAAHTTFTGPQIQPGYEKGWTVCNYSTQGQDSLLVSLYEKGTPLSTVSANASYAPTRISGIGSRASRLGTIIYVQQDSARSFSVIDESGGNLSLKQTEAIARAIVAH